MILEAAWVIALYFMFFFFLGTLKKDNSIVDMGWGIGFVVVAWYFVIRYRIFDAVSLFVSVLISLWGLRLFYHILRRNLGKPEDFRYATWRKAWGKWVVLRAFFQVYVLQGAMMFLIALPIVSTHEVVDKTFQGLTVLGGIVWLMGYFFEVVGDAQLAAFKKQPSSRGKLMTSGLWQYTRHPNYFGEATMWWGIWLIAVSVGAPWYVVISPLTITILLRFVSGVPLLEKSMKTREGYASYAKQTNVFFPWFRKGV